MYFGFFAYVDVGLELGRGRMGGSGRKWGKYDSSGLLLPGYPRYKSLLTSIHVHDTKGTLGYPAGDIDCP